MFFALVVQQLCRVLLKIIGHQLRQQTFEFSLAFNRKTVYQLRSWQWTTGIWIISCQKRRKAVLKMSLQVQCSLVSLLTYMKAIDYYLCFGQKACDFFSGIHQKRWFFANFQNNLLPSGEKSLVAKSLVIESVDRHEAGIYICEAKNGVGHKSATASIKLQVLCKFCHLRSLLHTRVWRPPPMEKKRPKNTFIDCRSTWNRAGDWSSPFRRKQRGPSDMHHSWESGANGTFSRLKTSSFSNFKKHLTNEWREDMNTPA